MISGFDLTDENEDYYMKKSTIEKSCTSLMDKLKEFEVMFTYYSTSTRNFFCSDAKSNNPNNTGVKFRRSTLKAVENLKFVPINLHVEQFVVETSPSPLFDEPDRVERTSYDFTSVGAFTTCHTSRQNVIKPVEVLMQEDKPFNFNPAMLTKKANLVENEIALHFYALKLFIQIANELIACRDLLITPERIVMSAERIKAKLETLVETVIDSYDLLMDEYIQIVKIERRQFFYNLKEKLTYFKLKFQAFLIEINIFLLNNLFDKFDSIFMKFVFNLIEFYVNLRGTHVFTFVLYSYTLPEF
jgi:hypothetical protein